MQEVLSRANDSQVPIQEREYYELRLDDICTYKRTLFSVGEARAFWSEIDRQIIGEGLQNLEFNTLEEARKLQD